MDTFYQLLLQLVLILLNAFFAATEIAIISLNEKKVKARADDGNKKAVKLLKIIKEPTKFLSTKAYLFLRFFYEALPRSNLPIRKFPSCYIKIQTKIRKYKTSAGIFTPNLKKGY